MSSRLSHRRPIIIAALGGHAAAGPRPQRRPAPCVPVRAYHEASRPGEVAHRGGTHTSGAYPPREHPQRRSIPGPGASQPGTSSSQERPCPRSILIPGASPSRSIPIPGPSHILQGHTCSRGGTRARGWWYPTTAYIPPVTSPGAHHTGNTNGNAIGCLPHW